VTLEFTVARINLLCFGGFRTAADDPPKPRRRWVCFLGTTGLPVGLHVSILTKVCLTFFQIACGKSDRTKRSGWMTHRRVEALGNLREGEVLAEIKELKERDVPLSEIIQPGQ